MRKITELPRYLDSLSVTQTQVFQRLYDVSADEGTMVVPDDMEQWVEDTFGSVDRVESQRIIRVANRLTDEAALFNSLRADRPVQTDDETDVEDVVEEHGGGPFGQPRTNTPEDDFGRIEGETAITASNVAKYDARHGLVIADEVNPLSFSEEDLQDRFAVVDEWFDKAGDTTHRYPFLMWNCLWKSGASIIHGHMQLLLAQDRPYRRIDTLERAARTYQNTFDEDLYDDIYDAHDNLGLSLGFDDVDAYAHLTPRKEKEVVITADAVSDSFVTAVHDVLRTFIDDLGVQSFNVGVYYPPLTDEDWELPVIARVVDRGSLDEKTTDMGGMEVYGGENVVASDPYDVKRAFEK